MSTETCTNEILWWERLGSAAPKTCCALLLPWLCAWGSGVHRAGWAGGDGFTLNSSGISIGKARQVVVRSVMARNARVSLPPTPQWAQVCWPILTASSGMLRGGVQHGPWRSTGTGNSPAWHSVKFKARQLATPESKNPKIKLEIFLFMFSGYAMKGLASTTKTWHISNHGMAHSKAGYGKYQAWHESAKHKKNRRITRYQQARTESCWEPLHTLQFSPRTFQPSSVVSTSKVYMDLNRCWKK